MPILAFAHMFPLLLPRDVIVEITSEVTQKKSAERVLCAYGISLDLRQDFHLPGSDRSTGPKPLK
jgi:hypothetical protein